MDCITTTLLSNINDSDLPKEDEIHFPLPMGQTAIFNIDTAVDVIGRCTASVIHSGTTTPVELPYTPEGTSYRIQIVADQEEDCIVVLTDKYHISRITYFQASYANPIDFRFSPMVYIGVYDFGNFDIKDLSYFTQATTISLAYQSSSKGRVRGSLDKFFPEVNNVLTNLTIGRSLVRGSLTNFGRLIHLSTLKVTSAEYLSGDVDTIFDTMVSNGRTSGELTITYDGLMYSSGGIESGDTVEFDSSYPGGWRKKVVE